MTHYFLDSSAIIKRHVTETGTNWIRSITDRSAGHRIFVAHITQAEVVSGVMRRQREGLSTARTARAIRLLFDRHMSRQYRIIGLTAGIVTRAEDLLEQYPLRAYDSIQLASALEANSQLLSAALSPLVFVSADTRLLSTASAVGIATDNPHNYP